MSKYTTEVRYICEVNANLNESKGGNDINSIIAGSRANIFNFTYPIFDESYRPTLESKILKHYYTREIGFETVGLWKHFLDMRMNEIMPYYNKLYESELIEFNPLYDVDYTREGNRTENEDRTDEETRTDAMTGTVADVGTGSNDMTGTVKDAGNGSDKMTGTVKDVGNGSDKMTGTVADSSTSTSTDGGTEGRQGSNVPKKDTWDLYSDTPQGGITGIQNASNDPSLASNAYLTNARHIIEDGTGSTEQSTTTFGKTNNSTNSNTRTYNTDNSTTDNNTRTYDTDNSTTDNNTRTYDTSNDTTNNNTRTYNTQNAIDGSKTGNTAREGEYFERIRGKMNGKSYAKMLQELRETFLNIDLMVINELSDLFMNIY